MGDPRSAAESEPPSDLCGARAAGVRAAALGIGYRSCTGADLPFLASVYASTRLEELAPLGWPDAMRDAFLAQQFQAQHTHYRQYYPDAEWLVVLEQGEAVGRLYIEAWPSQIRIIDIALLPEARGRGLGRAILSDVLEEAAATERKVSIHVEKANRAMRLYHALGFATVEDKGVYDLLEWHPGEGRQERGAERGSCTSAEASGGRVKPASGETVSEAAPRSIS